MNKWLAATIAVVVIAAVAAVLLYTAPPATQTPQPTVATQATTTPPTYPTPTQTPLAAATTQTPPPTTTRTQTAMQTPTPRAKYPLTVVDFANRTVTIPKRPERVVAIGPGTLRLVAYLNATDLVVGVEESEQRWTTTGRDYAMALGLDWFKSKSAIGPGGPDKPPVPELILKVNPDLVIMSINYATYGADKLQSEVGTPVIVVTYGTLGQIDVETLKRALLLLGKVLDREGRARQLAAYIDSLVEDLRKRTVNITKRPSVYVGAVSFKGAQPFTATQVPYPPLALLNTKSIVDDLGREGFVAVDFEYILKKDPDYIFIDEGNLQTVLQDFQKDKGKYCQLKAFREGRVYGLLPFNYYWTNIATAFADAYYLGKVLYPDHFADVDPVAKADEIFRAFLGKPLYEEYVKGGYPGFKPLADLFNCG